MPGLDVAGTGETDHGHAGGMRGLDPRHAILDHQALGRAAPHATGRQQVDGRVRLGPFRLVGGEQRHTAQPGIESSSLERGHHALAPAVGDDRQRHVEACHDLGDTFDGQQFADQARLDVGIDALQGIARQYMGAVAFDVLENRRGGHAQRLTQRRVRLNIGQPFAESLDQRLLGNGLAVHQHAVAIEDQGFHAVPR